MAEYIDREAFKRKLIDEKSFFPVIVSRALEEIPTADVVPKSEVEWLYKQVDCLSQEVMYNDDIAKMKVDEAKAEVAREIFEEIEKYIAYRRCGNGLIDDWIEDDIAELKKKYIGESDVKRDTV